MRVRSSLLGLSLSLAFGCSATQHVGTRTSSLCSSPAACEQRATERMQSLRGDPVALTAFLHAMPKGGDLHNHLSGAVYAESYLTWAHADGMRITHSFDLVDASHCPPDGCTELPVLTTDPQWRAVVDAWSMQDFHPDTESGHDHFFAAFNRFGPVAHDGTHVPAMLAEAMQRAWDEHAIYLELMSSVVAPQVNEIAHDLTMQPEWHVSVYENLLRADPRWAPMIAASQRALADADTQAHELLHCDTPQASPVCGLTVRYLSQIARTSPAPLVFAEMLASYEIRAGEPRLVGLNLASPEDNPTAQQDYDLQMSYLAYLGGEFRGRDPLHIALHAGELIPALVPPEHPGWLLSHIRHAVEIAGASRIGHGVDVLGEYDARGLLAEMHERGTTVEICLTSNNTILGVSGAAHPLSAYLAAGVPTVLATDDAGVSRSSLTGEYVRAVTVQGVTYTQLKAMARQSLTAAFVAGASLWDMAYPTRFVPACTDSVGVEQPSPECAQFLSGNPRARLQYALEGQFQTFEQHLPP